MQDTKEKQRLAQIDGCAQKIAIILNQYNKLIEGAAPLAKKPDAFKVLEAWAKPKKKVKKKLFK